ncbi:MAG: 1,4-alpha-glucan branching protein GlgB, partial [Lachnospiraceae bacterium]|nr:1,4-alpha-glucan branching protein GlgB [Lachnospiraceae bacterium]
DGSYVDHCDPYGFYSELRPKDGSIIFGLNDGAFHDDSWIKKRTELKDGPINIYEIHFGSWKRKSDEPGDWYTYEEMAELLIPYLKENGFNYVEIMPLSEHPMDESWGYQTTGFYSPTSRYGNPDQLRYFVDQCHLNDIGVIFDFVPVHFAVNDYALRNYDGTALYEYPHYDVGRSEWGSCNFMVSRGEVRSFLQSCAHYWLKEFHFDGLRIDAISNLLYWQGNPERGVNDMAVKFLKGMNSGVKERVKGALLMAEDSTTYPGVTKPVWEGGLGFDYKWDMGWMNDTLSYFKLDPDKRTENYHKLTFSMMYYYSEYFLLPFSHDEVVHGKATILQKMNGDYEAKFPQARALYMYMFAHPGKKLNFMGNEFGQFREWDEKREQDWSLLTYPMHDGFAHFFRALCNLYQSNPAFWEQDYAQDGFQWIDCHQEQKCIYAFERRSKSTRLAAIFNFSDQQQDYTLTIRNASTLKLLLSSNLECYGGTSKSEPSTLTLENEATPLSLPPFSAYYYDIQ